MILDFGTGCCKYQNKFIHNKNNFCVSHRFFFQDYEYLDISYADYLLPLSHLQEQAGGNLFDK